MARDYVRDLNKPPNQRHGYDHFPHQPSSETGGKEPFTPGISQTTCIILQQKTDAGCKITHARVKSDPDLKAVTAAPHPPPASISFD